MLKRITIENYRSCLRTTIDLHPELSVLIGPNGSGKTNILQGMMFLHKMSQRGDNHGFGQDRITVSSRIRAEFCPSKYKANLKAAIDSYTDESNNDVMVSSRQKWELKRSDGEKAKFELPISMASFINAALQGRYYGYVRRGGSVTLLRRGTVPKWTIPAMERIAKFCKGIRYYGASQFTNPGACPASFQIEQEEGYRRPIRLRGHAKVLYDMYSASKAKSSGSYQQFLEVVGPRGLRLIDDLGFREVPTSSVDYSVRVGGKIETRRRHKLLVVPQFKIGKQKLSPNQLSEGTFKTLALLFHVLTEDSTALLIEEPEVCVHHGLLSSILELIKSASKSKQMIISTHSDYVLDHVGPENVYRVKFEKNSGTTVSPIAKTMTAREFAGLREYLEKEGNLGEFWREAGFGDRP